MTRRKSPLKITRLLLLLVLFALSWLPLETHAQQATAPRRVLVLYWYDKGFSGHVAWDQSFQAILKSTPDNIEYYPEYLEANRFPGENQSQVLHDYLLKKYADRTIDVVVAQSDASLGFLLKYRNDLFRNVPIVFYSASGLLPSERQGETKMTGVVVISSYKRTLELALSLNPEVNQVFVVSGSLDHDKRFEVKAREQLREFEGRVQLNYLTDLAPEELIARTASLPQRSIVLYAWQQSRDAQGKLWETAEILSSLTRATPVPIFGMSAPLVGRGIVGGHVYTVEASAAMVADKVRKIADGERAQDIPIENVPTVPMFDWRELRRWRISEDSLPPGSVIQFKELTFWALYKWYVVGLTTACTLEALLIAWLLLLRARRRQAELESARLASVAEAERRHLRSVVSNVPGIVWEARLDAITGTGRATFMSEYVEKMLGYTAEEFISIPGFGVNLVHEEDRERVIRDGATLARKGGSIQFRWIAKDGRVVWAEAHLAPILDEVGTPIGMRGVTLDITEHKMAEQARRQSEERNRAILKAIPDRMFLQTRDGVYLDYHAQRPSDLLLPPKEFLGKNMRDVLPPELASDLSKCFEYAEEENVQILEYGLPMNGSEQWFEARVVRTGENILSVVRDVTARKTAEEALRQSEARFRNMADTAPVMIWVAGTDRLCKYFNKPWLEFTGRTMEDEVDNGWVESVHPDDYALCCEIYSSAFDRREPFKMEYRLRRADGQYRWVFNSGSPRLSSNGEFVGLIGSCIDITDRKEAEEELRRAHAELNQLKNQLEAENIYLQQELQLDQTFGEIVGQSDPIKYVLSKISQVSLTDASVLISGETGTGKELVARAIHAAGARKDRSLIRVNCAALSASLIESELFGHEKGAFTGAAARNLGRFELADRGTIFLDEIGELPLELQVKLLRVLQEGELERVGGSKTIKVDVRIIAATNRNLKLEVDKGNFREDLWYRLNVFPITVPPLRQRKEDIPLMVDHFASKFARSLGKTITSVSPRSMQRLQAHSWPGNVRELANVIERAVIHTQGSVLHLADSLEQAREESPATLTLEEMEREYIIRTLENTGWRIEGPYGAAKALGLNSSTLRARMNKFGIQRPRAVAQGS
jgi:formate hydrogenlyase transcriptional activator